MGIKLISDELAGYIAYALTKRLVIDMPTARAAVDEAVRMVSAHDLEKFQEHAATASGNRRA